MKALIVDPDARAARQTRAHLQEQGCQAATIVSTGSEALCLARAPAAVDIVMLELELPDMDGLVTCRRLSSLLTGVPIITCSTRVDDDVLMRVREAGAHDFIAKPFRGGELALRVCAALRLREERLRRDQHEHRLLQWARRLAKSKRDLESTICIDPLTGVANRRHFNTLLRTEWRRAARDGTQLSLVFFDLDEFHAFNEQYGHVGGDACLARVATALAHGLRRASDVLARYGGEEFVAVLPDTDERGACVVAERLRGRIEDLAIPHAGATRNVLTISAGVATRTATAARSAEMLVEAADAALFRAKREGRNRFRADGIESARVTVQRRPWPSCPVVVLDPVLVQRVPRFLETARSQLEIGDPAELLQTAQRIRRGAEALGFTRVTELAARVEADAKTGAGSLQADVDELVWYLEHVQVVYRRAILKAV